MNKLYTALIAPVFALAVACGGEKPQDGFRVTSTSGQPYQPHKVSLSDDVCTAVVEFGHDGIVDEAKIRCKPGKESQIRSLSMQDMIALHDTGDFNFLM